MTRKIIAVFLICLLLAGCSDTQVYIPEERLGAESGEVVHIPVNPDKEEETEAPLMPTETEPEETEPPQTHSATITQKPSSSSNKGSSGTQSSTNKGTITGNSEKPKETQPATEPENTGSDTITDSTATEPAVTEATTEPEITEPVETKPAATEATTEPEITEPVETKPAATEATTEPETTDPVETEPAATEPPETEPEATEAATESEPTEPEETEPAVTEPETEPAPTEPPMYDISGYVLGAMEYAMVNQINAYRVEAGLAELQMDEWLCAIASCRSYEASFVWSHTRPDGRGFASVLSDYGYAAGNAEELLVYALGFADGTAMVDRWMQSDAHKQLLLGDWSTVGVGAYESGGYIYVTCLLVG